MIIPPAADVSDRWLTWVIGIVGFGKSRPARDTTSKQQENGQGGT